MVAEFGHGALVLLADVLQRQPQVGIVACIFQVVIERLQPFGFFMQDGNQVVGKVIEREWCRLWARATA